MEGRASFAAPFKLAVALGKVITAQDVPLNPAVLIPLQLVLGPFVISAKFPGNLSKRPFRGRRKPLLPIFPIIFGFGIAASAAPIAASAASASPSMVRLFAAAQLGMLKVC